MSTALEPALHQAAKPAPPAAEVEPDPVASWYDRSSITADAMVMIAGQTPADFERHAPETRFCDYIDGVVYMPSPVSIDHGDIEDDVGGWMFMYRASTPGVAGSTNASTVMLESMPQPDRHLRILSECGGGTWIEDNYLIGAPEFTTEVCVSSAAYDLHQKLDLYEKAGVQEYLALLVYEQEVRWHVLVNGRYERLPPDADGVLRSRAFPGLWLHPQALLNRDIALLLATLQQGLASPEHRQFVEELARRRGQA